MLICAPPIIIKILSFLKGSRIKFNLAFYLDSVDTSLGATTTSRAVDRKKKQVADEHEKYVENALTKYSKIHSC